MGILNRSFLLCRRPTGAEVEPRKLTLERMSLADLLLC